MKKSIMGLCAAGTAVLLCAAALLLRVEKAQKPSAAADDTPRAVQADSSKTAQPQPFDAGITLQVLTEDGVETMQLDEYLTGVLLAETPADFPPEALKAQAIASRTFALRQAEAHKHNDAHVCTNPACCQGFAVSDDAEAIEAMVSAVRETDGLVVTYADGLIDATFFSCSGGRTETAAAVWGGEIPYLQSVESPGEEAAPRYTETVTLSAAEFAQKLQEAHPEANLAGTPQGWFGAATYTEGGGIDTIFLGGTAVTGRELRSLFSLRSTEIVFTPQEDTVQITTHGFGHRVGMSQYGAKAMAENGDDFVGILTHYYQNAEVRRLQLKT